MALITASPANFVRLLEIQKQSLEATQAIKTLLDSGPPAKREEESLKIQKAQFEIDKKSLKLSEDELKAQQTFLTIGEKLKGLIPSMPTGFGMKQGLLKSLNFGGVLNKTIAKNEFVKSQKDLGSTKSSSELKDDFETRHTAKKDYDKADKTLQEFKKSNPGLTDEEIKKRAAPDSKIGMAVAQKMAAVKTIAGLSKPEINTDAAAKAKSFDVDEQDVEAGKKADENSKVLKKIEENTSALAPPGKSGKPVAAAEGKGLFSGLAGGVGKAIGGMKTFGIGLVAIAAGLWAASLALENFGKVDWDSIEKGMVALGGIVLAAVVLDKMKGSILKGAFVLGILGLALYGIGEVFKGFAELDWETVGKGFVMIAGLGVIAAIMGAAFPYLILGAAALAAIGVALIPLAYALDLAKDGMAAFADTMERLSKLDVVNLALLGPALVSLGVGMAAFGVGQAATGLTNLVTGFFGAISGQKSPVDQIIAIGNAGEGVQKVGTGIKNLAEGMAQFSAVDPEKIKAIAALPLDKIAAMGLAINSGNRVANSSSDNQSGTMALNGKSSNNTVVAPTTNTTVNKQSTIVELPVRNQEQTMNRYMRSRFST